MTPKPRNILVFGATGLIGKYITNALLSAKDDFERIAIFCSQSSAERKKDLLDDYLVKGALIIIGDIQNEEVVAAAYHRYDTVVSALGREAIAMQINLIRIAEQSSTIKRFLPSEFGTDIEYSEPSTHERVHQEKLKVRSYFRDHVQRLEHTYLMTGPYADYYFGMGAVPQEPEVGSFDAKAKEAWLLEPADAQIAWTTMRDVGRFTVAALLHPEQSCNRAVKVKSFVASHADILAEFEKQTESKWDVQYTSLDKLKVVEDDAWEKDTWWKYTSSLRKLWMRGETLYPEWDNEALGVVDLETLADVVANAVKNA